MKNDRITIGFAGLIDFTSIIGQQIVLGIEEAAKDFNINIINFISTIRYSASEDIENYSHFKDNLKYLNLSNIDGLISMSSTLKYIMSREEIENFYLSLKPMPVVSIGMPFENIPSILHDNYSSIKEIMNHLIINHKYTKLAFIGCKGLLSYDERLSAYKKLLKENNIPFKNDLVHIINNVDDQQEIKHTIDIFLKKRKLEFKKDIEAIITVSDLIAQKLIIEIKNLGFKVPNDVAVVGFNNQLDSVRSVPPITTLDPHFFKMGYLSVSILNSMFEKTIPQNKILMPCELIIRQSCGCFENLIIKAEIKEESVNENKKTFDYYINENYVKLIENITSLIIKIDDTLNESHAKELLDGLTRDVISDSSSSFLHIIQKYFFDNKNISDEKLISWQDIISEIRSLLLPYYFGNNKISNKIENIFHQARVMVDVAYSYINYSKKGDVYKEGNIARIATDFMMVDDMDKVFNLIKKHINKLDIPGLYLSIYDEPKTEIINTKLIFIHYKNNEIVLKKTGLLLPCSQIVPKDLMPSDRRFSMIFELLYYKGSYLGFILFELGSLNIPLYDTLKTILSPSIYRAITSNKKQDIISGSKKFLLNDINAVSDESLNESVVKRKKFKSDHFMPINRHKILEYLYNHVNDPTDLIKMANDFKLSVNSLIRKTKKLTGFTIQKLHEQLKIEKAKILLNNKELTISEIAEQLGYQNQFYFSSVFKKVTGISPKKWIELNFK
ncbi:MAG: substrate-binding domain-containing protein [Spirochaetes bacterium]|nr:substrate-binding domain-containing protein [Spirochaetota bacterium]